MSVPHERLREWIISRLDQRDVYGLEWEDRENMYFKIIWLHQRNSEWKEEYGQVFMEWARHTGKYNPDRGDKKDYPQWKTTLRNALHKCDEFEVVKKFEARAKPYPYRIYQILPRKRKKTPQRQQREDVMESDRALPVNEDSSNLPAMLDDMSSPLSSLSSPAQLVPGNIATWGAENRNERRASGDSESVDNSQLTSPLGEVHDGNEQMNMLPDLDRFVLSNNTPNITQTDVLQMAVTHVGLTPSLEDKTTSKENAEYTLVTNKNGGNIIEDPNLGQQFLCDDLLNSDVSMKSLSLSSSDFAAGSLGELVSGAIPVTTVSSSDAIFSSNNIMPSVIQQPAVHNTSTNTQGSTYQSSTISSISSEVPSHSGIIHGSVVGTSERNPLTGPMEYRAASSSIMESDENDEVIIKEKYKFPDSPDHTCDLPFPCHLFIELLYMGHLVREWKIPNIHGCLLHCKVDPNKVKKGMEVGVDINAVYGPEKRTACDLPQWPKALTVKSPKKVDELFNNLRRGLMIESRNGTLYVIRLSQLQLYYTPDFNSDLVEIPRTKNNPTHEEVMVFDYENKFKPALQKYKEGNGPKPATGVYITVGQKSLDKNKLYFIVRVTSCRALCDLQNAQKEKEDKSLSIALSSGDDYDRIDSYLNKMTI